MSNGGGGGNQIITTKIGEIKYTRFLRILKNWTPIMQNGWLFITKIIASQW